MEDQDIQPTEKTDVWGFLGKVAIALVLLYVGFHIFGVLLILFLHMALG